MFTWDKTIVVTNRKLAKRPFLIQLEQVCKRQPKAVILREKDLPPEQYEQLLKQAAEICLAWDVPLIPHFYPQAAKNLGFSSIHLPLWKLTDPQFSADGFEQIGCSVHSVEQALQAQQHGATYLLAGHIFETDCKKGVSPRGIPFLQQVVQAVSVPVYAIGGIHPENAPQTLAAGAAGYCIMSAAMQQV
jgi:thiamine-phosphate pyrophosphorylase